MIKKGSTENEALSKIQGSWDLCPKIILTIPTMEKNSAKKFQSMLNKDPLVYSLVYSIIKEQKRTENELVRLKSGVKIKYFSLYLLLIQTYNIH
ncbi:hypothetical protein BpHYR1_038990 [Brachionus plicatilis]|uniref:Uncharacterized protein n=1 Tax=Brachionus plicatilis TaxID=10195 RepID=A0A3M7R7H6_BRAPC|nr:hypothetical protein BpHYR1_038990 [Brachionus plicatilis]